MRVDCAAAVDWLVAEIAHATFLPVSRFTALGTTMQVLLRDFDNPELLGWFYDLEGKQVQRLERSRLQLHFQVGRYRNDANFGC